MVPPSLLAGVSWVPSQGHLFLNCSRQQQCKFSVPFFAIWLWEKGRKEAPLWHGPSHAPIKTIAKNLGGRDGPHPTGGLLFHHTLTRIPSAVKIMAGSWAVSM